jgi:hypothetical protein
MGVEKGFAVKDINNDGLINGADFGFYYDDIKFVTNSPSNPVASAKADVLAQHVYDTEVVANKKKYILLGEAHFTKAEDVALGVVRKARAEGKSVTYALEYPKDEYADVEAYLKTVSPEDLENGTARHFVLTAFIRHAAPDGAGASEEQLYTAFNAKKAEHSPRACAMEHLVDTLIEMKKCGANIAFVDMNAPKPKEGEDRRAMYQRYMTDPQRDKTIGDNVAAAGEGQDLVVASLGIAHVAGDRAHSPRWQIDDGVSPAHAKCASASDRLSEVKPGEVARVILAPDANDAWDKFLAGEVNKPYYDEFMTIFNNGNAEMPMNGEKHVPPKGGLTTIAADQFLYYDWR